MEMTIAMNQALACHAKLGEGVIWDDKRKVVWFVDIKQKLLWHFDPASGSNAHAEAPEQIGWALPAESGLLLCGLADGLYTFDPEKREFTRLMGVPGERASNRLNDACTDPYGRVWFGTMDDGEKARSGRFYVFDRGSIRPAGPDGIAITNGPAVNADGTKIYFTDTLGKQILVADLTADGVGEARHFVDTAKYFPDAHPDGPVCDAQGALWSAFYGGGCVARFLPDGQLDMSLPVPARDVTKMGFGGANFTTAYVTTATKNMSDDDMKTYPLAGSLFSFAAPVNGFAQTPVRLS